MSTTSPSPRVNPLADEAMDSKINWYYQLYTIDLLVLKLILGELTESEFEEKLKCLSGSNAQTDN